MNSERGAITAGIILMGEVVAGVNMGCLKVKKGERRWYLIGEAVIAILDYLGNRRDRLECQKRKGNRVLRVFQISLEYQKSGENSLPNCK